MKKKIKYTIFLKKVDFSITFIIASYKPSLFLKMVIFIKGSIHIIFIAIRNS